MKEFVTNVKNFINMTEQDLEKVLALKKELDATKKLARAFTMHSNHWCNIEFPESDKIDLASDRLRDKIIIAVNETIEEILNEVKSL